MLFNLLLKVASFFFFNPNVHLQYGISSGFCGPGLCREVKRDMDRGRETDRLTDTAQLIAQLNAIWKARSPRISA